MKLTITLSALRYALKTRKLSGYFDMKTAKFEMEQSKVWTSKDDPTTYPIFTKAGKISKRYVDRICVDCNEVEVTCIDR